MRTCGPNWKTSARVCYYGTRYYDPRNGRFISRDTIGEAGGVNLYAFISNNAVNSYDVLGREDGLWGPNPNGGSNWVGLDGRDGQDYYDQGRAAASAMEGTDHLGTESSSFEENQRQGAEQAVAWFIQTNGVYGNPFSADGSYNMSRVAEVLNSGAAFAAGGSALVSILGSASIHSSSSSETSSTKVAHVNVGQPYVVSDAADSSGGGKGGGGGAGWMSPPRNYSDVLNDVDQRIAKNPSATINLSNGDMKIIMDWDAQVARALLNNTSNLLAPIRMAGKAGDGTFRRWGGTKFNINGIMSTAGEINYLTQGMASAAMGWASPDYKMIDIWNTFKGRGSDNQIGIREYWAYRGYVYYMNKKW